MALTVTYLLEDTALYGGVKVVLHHANLLVARGHRVTVVSRGERPDWYPLRAGFVRVPHLRPEALPRADVTVATFWTTIAAACAVGSGQPLHFCQGFEGGLLHNTQEHEQIEAAYREPIPAIVVAPHLSHLLRSRFSRVSAVVPPALERYFRAELRLGSHVRPRILVMHPWEFYLKGVESALEAVMRLRAAGLQCRLVRVSQWPLCDAERAMVQADHFYLRLPPQRVAQVVRGCDLLLAPSWEQEGFGLPVLEAFGSGVPVVASEIASFRWFAGSAAVLVPPRDPAALAAAAKELLSSQARWRQARARGRAVARQFAEVRVADALEKALDWAANGGWRDGSPPPEWA